MLSTLGVFEYVERNKDRLCAVTGKPFSPLVVLDD